MNANSLQQTDGGACPLCVAYSKAHQGLLNRNCDVCKCTCNAVYDIKNVQQLATEDAHRASSSGPNGTSFSSASQSNNSKFGSGFSYQQDVTRFHGSASSSTDKYEEQSYQQNSITSGSHLSKVFPSFLYDSAESAS
jgi:hypothetical protein